MGRVIASVTIQGSKVVKVSAQRTGRARLDSAITSALSKAWKGRAMAGVGNAEIKLPIMLQQAMFSKQQYILKSKRAVSFDSSFFM